MFNQKGISQLLILPLLVGGITLGVYLASQQTNLSPQAAGIKNKTPSSFTLDSSKKKYKAGETFSVNLIVHSDLNSVNLIIAKLNFPSNLLQVESIETTSSIIKFWPEKFFDNSNGQISLIGGLPSPGFSTSPKLGLTLATINFKAKSAGVANIKFDGSSAMHRDSDNTNILATRNDLSLSIAKAKK